MLQFPFCLSVQCLSVHHHTSSHFLYPGMISISETINRRVLGRLFPSHYGKTEINRALIDVESHTHILFSYLILSCFYIFGLMLILTHTLSLHIQSSSSA